jgi:hypothetical protein
MKTDGQHKTYDWSSGRPGALLEMSYFTDKFAIHHVVQYYFETGEDGEQPGSILGDTIQCPQKCAFFENYSFFVPAKESP